MTNEPKPTYEELEIQIEQLQRDVARWRKSSDDNYASGMEWKDQAGKLTSQIKDAVSNEMAAQTEAAELRGYIRRVNDLDPKRVRQRVEHTGQSNHDIERMMRRR